MENPGLLSKTSTVAKAVTSAALHSKNKNQQNPNGPILLLQGRKKSNVHLRKEKEKERRGGGTRHIFPRVNDPPAKIVLSA